MFMSSVLIAQNDIFKYLQTNQKCCTKMKRNEIEKKMTMNF